MIDARTRDLAGATITHLLAGGVSGPALIDRLVSEGWLDLRAEDEAAAVEVLFSAQGAQLAERSPALDLAVGAALRDRLGDGVVPGADGRRLHVLYPCAGGVNATVGRLEDGGRVDVDGLALAGLEAEAEAVLVAGVEDGGATVLAVVDAGEGREVDRVEGLDPSLGLRKVALRGRPAVVVGGEAGRAAWQAAVDTGRRALGHELVGATQAALDVAVAYVAGRRQFGRAIGTFQAVRHHLADVYVAAESARLALAEAWVSDDSLQTAVAKAMAGEAHALAARWCLQVLGAIGFTWEHGLHRHLRRGWTLDVLLGSAAELTAAAGASLVEGRFVPRHGDLSPV